MEKKDTGGPAFPAHHFDMTEGEHGMDLRDYFAAKNIVQCLYVRSIHTRPGEEAYAIARAAEDAYEVADAMLKARKA